MRRLGSCPRWLRAGRRPWGARRGFARVDEGGQGTSPAGWSAAGRYTSCA